MGNFCIKVFPVHVSLSDNLSLFLSLSTAMHLFGLNWQLQETEGYAFENGQVKSDATATNAVTALSTENSKGQTHTYPLTHRCII